MVGQNMKEIISNFQSMEMELPEDTEKNLELNQDNKALDLFLRGKLKNKEFIFQTREECDLTNLEQTKEYFSKVKPSLVIHLAAKVGGLFANMADKVQFYEVNMKINQNVIECCKLVNVDRLVCALSTCIYPDVIDYPIDELKLHNGPPHPSNEGYAMAKRMCELQCRLNNQSFGSDRFLCCVPTNLYGKYDNYSTSTSHVVAALIRKGYNASLNKDTKFEIYGSGTPMR
jgi:GDP-L-fucose synthase